jgi:hypothetical protein
MKRIKLKPCPFCGGKAEIIDCNVFADKAKRIRCTGCRVYTPPILIDHPAYSFKTFPELDESTRYTAAQAAEKAAEFWNRRANNEQKSN